MDGMTNALRRRAPGLDHHYNRLRGRVTVADIDLSAAHVIAEAPTDALRDPLRLESLVTQAGLHTIHEVVPPAMHAHLDRGLRVFQLPVQFAPYLLFLSGQPIGSYLEIGLEHGGSFVLTSTYLKAVGKELRHEVAVDLRYAPGVGRYARKVRSAEHWVIDTASPEFRARTRALAPLGLVLIDGDHSYSGCMRDFETVHDHANVIAFHDIVDSFAVDVPRVWSDVRREHAEVYDFVEFAAQYPKSERGGAGERFFGIGVATRKRPL